MSGENNYKYEIFEEYIHFEFPDTINFQRAIKYADYIKEVLIKENKNRIMAKVKADKKPLPRLEDYKLANYYVSTGLTFIIAKAAIVVNKEALKALEFWETATFNRHGNIKVFSQLDEAKKWLLER